MKSTSNLDEVLEMLCRLSNTSTFRYEVEKLRAIRSWAIEQLDVDYVAGDRVVIKDDYFVPKTFADGTAHGWWGYRECLVPGAIAIVEKIDFNDYHKYWYANIILDQEWSISEFPWDAAKYPDGVKRYWKGPLAETPTGFEPPSLYDQEQYPEGRKHTWAFEAQDLSKVLQSNHKED